jgi:hypothetical protein
MPPRTEAIKDFVIDGQPADGSVRLVPEAVFSGYWFGGSMWRGAIVVNLLPARANCHLRPGPFGEKQNPALVFTIKVWPDQAARNANSSFLPDPHNRAEPLSFCRRPGLCGFAAGGLNFLLGRLWSRHLAAHNCGEIYKLRRTERGTEITCELPVRQHLQPGMEGAVYRPSGERLCSAPGSQLRPNNDVLMVASGSEIVRLGDVRSVSLPRIIGPFVFLILMRLFEKSLTSNQPCFVVITGGCQAHCLHGNGRATVGRHTASRRDSICVLIATGLHPPDRTPPHPTALIQGCNNGKKLSKLWWQHCLAIICFSVIPLFSSISPSISF